jgi:drug/metabolite transporter (DMT)-like permease
MSGLIWRAAPYIARLFWPAVLGAALGVLGVVAFADGRNGDMPLVFAVPAAAAAALGVACCLLWAALSIRIYRRRDIPPPPL